MKLKHYLAVAAPIVLAMLAAVQPFVPVKYALFLPVLAGVANVFVEKPKSPEAP